MKNDVAGVRCAWWVTLLVLVFTVQDALAVNWVERSTPPVTKTWAAYGGVLTLRVYEDLDYGGPGVKLKLNLSMTAGASNSYGISSAAFRIYGYENGVFNWQSSSVNEAPSGHQQPAYGQSTVNLEWTADFNPWNHPVPTSYELRAYVFYVVPNEPQTQQTEVLWTYHMVRQASSTAMKSLPWTVTNGKNYDVRIEVLNTANSVLQTVDVPALQTVSRATLANVLTWVASSSATVGVRVRVPANYVNGQWVSCPITSGDTIAVGVYPGLAYNSPGEQPPTDPPYVFSLPSSGMPEDGTIPPSSQPVWAGAGDTAPLDKGTYREGVEKQVNELGEIKELLSGDGLSEEPTSADFPTAPANGALGSFVFGNVTATSMWNQVGNTIGLLPEFPVVLPSSIQKTSVFAATLSFPYVGNQSFSVDMNQYEGPVLAIRLMLKSLFALWFFFVSCITIRKAFAG
jgi:hypothetical protein